MFFEGNYVKKFEKLKLYNLCYQKIWFLFFDNFVLFLCKFGLFDLKNPPKSARIFKYLKNIVSDFKNLIILDF